MSSMNSCCAVCVTYNPDPDVLQDVVSSVSRQVEMVCIVDNGSDVAVGDILKSFDNVEGIFWKDNKGIAAAHNAGVDYAKKSGCRFIILLDQDSILPPGAIERYLEVHNRQQDSVNNIAALGPRFRNPKNGHMSMFVRSEWFRNSYHRCKDGSSLVDADFLISSGSFYDISTFERVGLFNEGLFIDHVDTEWCLRAKDMGLACLGIEDIVMTHSLGECSLRFWFLRWYAQPIHKPFRLYYIFRNSLLLYRFPHSPAKWISGDVLRLARLFAVYLLFYSDRKSAVRWMLKGLADGLRGKTGMAA